jgi:hypothetical protein
MSDISKTMLQAEASSHGFKTVDPDALDLLCNVADKIVTNVLKNVCAVATVCKVKTAKEEHFKVVSFIQRTVLKETGTVKGGKIVLPSEYFSGEASGQYHEKVDVQPMESLVSHVDSMFITRPAMPIKVMGGGSDKEEYINATIKKLQKDKVISCNVSKEGKKYVTMSLEDNIAALLSAVRNVAPKTATLTKKTLDATIAKNARFAHII